MNEPYESLVESERLLASADDGRCPSAASQYLIADSTDTAHRR